MPDFDADFAPERVQSAQTRTSRSLHGLTPGQVEVLFERQRGRCAVCGTNSPGQANWSIDHDHQKARLHGHRENVGCPRCVRGILCKGCNDALGGARDDPEVLERLAAYVRYHRNRAV